MAKSENRTKKTTIVVFRHRDVRAPIDSDQFRIFDPSMILAFEAKAGGGTRVTLTQNRISTGARVWIQENEGTVVSSQRQSDRFQLVVEGLCPSEAMGLETLGLIQVLR